MSSPIASPFNPMSDTNAAAQQAINNTSDTAFALDNGFGDSASNYDPTLDTSAAGGGMSAGMGAGIGGIIGGLAGLYGAGQGNSAAAGTYQNAMNAYQNILNSVNANNLQVALQQAQMTNYGPAVLQAAPTIAPSAYQNLGPNQQILAQQMGNNAALQGVAASGYTPEMLAAYNNMLNASNANFQSQMAGIQQSAAARGMGSSGQSLAMQEQAAQAALNNASQASGNIAAQGFQNKLAAMSQLGGLTNQQQAQLSSLAAQQAQGLQQNAQYGTTLTSDIAAQNIARQQQQANAQTQAANQFAQYNNQIANQQAMQNEVNARLQAAGVQLGAAGGMGRAAQGLAGVQQSQGQATGAGLGNVIGGIASIAALA